MSNKKENGKTDVNVDMRNGKLKFEVSIFSLTTAAGAAFNILLKYDSSAMPYVYETWNREVNTGLLGSGWSLNIEDNIFAVVDGADLRYFLAFKGMLFTLMQDEVTTDKITYKTSPISNYIVEYVTQGYFMLYDEYGIKYIFGRDDSFSVNEKGAYNSFTGMYEKSSDEYLNVRKKISHPTGDNDPVSPDVDNTISSTRENSVSWGGWNGPSVNTLNQFSKTTCWRLSHIMDAFGGMIVFSYIQHISNVAKGEESKQYCICSYLYRITVYLNQIETENDTYIEIYDDKNYDLIGKLYFDSELKNFVSNNGIVQFYCFDNYVYIRNFSDYGAIGKIESNQVKTLLDLPNLRIAYNGKNTQDNYYGFFLRSGKDFYLLDVYTDTLYQTNLELSQDESIRNAISDGNDICISIMNERDTETFTTKNTIIVDFDKLKKSISVLTS